MVDVEAAAWVKAIPAAPEYHPTESEFADPITFILRVQEEAGQFGICKVVPPASKQPRKAFLSNLTSCLAAAQGKQQVSSAAVKFPLQRQRLGRPPSQTKGGSCTLEQFETKAKAFARGKLGTTKDVSSPGLETLFWRFMDEDKQTFVELSGELSGSAFPETGIEQADVKKRRKVKESCSGWKLAGGPWNMRNLAQLPGSLFKFMPSSVPGVTHPVVCISMLFTWSAWQTEEHELHGLSYLHTGASKSWYAVPPEAAAAFEDVVRVHGGAGENGAASVCPELLVSHGVPCCRLVQNAGEFVVIFPRSYNLNFSHGFSCSEASKFPAPGWLKAARQAAARRVTVDSPPLFCREQLLYQAALAFSKSSITSEVRSSRLKHKKKLCVDEALKTEFVDDFMKVQELLEKLVAAPQSKSILLTSGSTGEGEKENLCNLVNLGTIDSISLLSFVCESMEGTDEKAGEDICSASALQSPRVDWGASSCAVCGILCYSCIVIVQPTLEASRKLLNGMAREDFGRRSGSINRRRAPNRHASATGSKAAALPASILCPEHALQVQVQLQNCGGSRALVVYHPDYQTFDRNAREIAKDLSMDCFPKELQFDKGSEEDFQLINAAMDAGAANSWITRLQLTTPLAENKKTESSESEEEDELLVEKTLKEKKWWIVGRWCGRVWRYDQAHALLGGCMNLADVQRKTSEPAAGSAEVVNSGKRKDSPAAVEEVKSGNDEAGSVKKNCRKKKRTQMVAVWRVESEPRTDFTGLSSGPPLVADSNEAEIMAKSTENQSHSDTAYPASDELPATTEDPELLTVPGGDELPAAEGDELQPADDAVKFPEPSLVSSEAEEVRELVSAELCNGESAAGKDDSESQAQTPCKEEAKSEPGTSDVPPESVQQQEEEVSGEDSKGVDAEPDVRQYEEQPANEVEKLVEDEDAGVQAFSSEEPQLLDAGYSLEESEDPEPASAYETTQGGDPPGSTFCVLNNSLWHEVPISFSETFRGLHMEKAKAGWSAGRPRTVKSGRRSKIRLIVNDEDRSFERGAEEELSQEVYDQEGRESDVSRRSQELFTPAEEDSLNRYGEDEAVNTRATRSKRKSWKALAAVDNSERPAKSSRKTIGGKKLPSSAKVQTRKKAAYVDSDEVHACDFEGCTMSFSTASDLSLHKRNICTIKECGKRLCSHSYLMQHYRVHVDDRPLKCPWKGCKKTFKWSWARTEHIRVHTGERPYTCSDCGKSYRFVSDFSRHKRTTGHSS